MGTRKHITLYIKNTDKISKPKTIYFANIDILIVVLIFLKIGKVKEIWNMERESERLGGTTKRLTFFHHNVIQLKRFLLNFRDLISAT